MSPGAPAPRGPTSPAAPAPRGATSPEDPSPALAAFADAALAQARRTEQGSPDPRVGIAFALGWQIAEIYRPDPAPPPPPGEDDHLPALSDLSADEWARVGLYQVQAGITKLWRTIDAAGLEVPDAQEFAQLLTGLTGVERDRAIEAFHIELLATLTAADFRLGKGYGLGRALADVTRNRANWRGELSPRRVATLAAWLRDLSTALAPHAGHVVASSVEEWGRWAVRPAHADDAARESLDMALLQAQGRLWRSLISGEKRASEMLEMRDYVSAGECVLKSTGRLAKPVLKHHAPLLIAAALLFLAGIAVMLITDDAAGIVSGAGVILTAVGIGWKGVGTAAGKALAKLETPLWEAALDVSIRDRITPQHILDHVPVRPSGPDEPSLAAVVRAHATPHA
jgi:hypothetical protein